VEEVARREGLGIVFLMVVDEVEDNRQHRRLNLTHVQSRILLPNDFVQTTQTSAQG
jgi:hypothetical protein